MIVRREKYYIKKINKLNDFNYDTQKKKKNNLFTIRYNASIYKR